MKLKLTVKLQLKVKPTEKMKEISTKVLNEWEMGNKKI